MTLDYFVLCKYSYLLTYLSVIIELLEDLYSNTVSFVRINSQMPDWFDVTAGMWQGCIVAPDGCFLSQVIGS